MYGKDYKNIMILYNRHVTLQHIWVVKLFVYLSSDPFQALCLLTSLNRAFLTTLDEDTRPK